jgi:hypothetical protein
MNVYLYFTTFIWTSDDLMTYAAILRDKLIEHIDLVTKQSQSILRGKTCLCSQVRRMGCRVVSNAEYLNLYS